MLPVFVLELGHIIRTAVNFTQQLVVIVNVKLSIGKAHGGGAVAATAALVENKGPVLGVEAVNDGAGGGGDGYFGHGKGFSSVDELS
jgi:hypothetical protein